LIAPDAGTGVRPLRLSDVPGAVELSEAVGWNQTPEDWSRILSLEPQGCFCVQSEGRVAATASLLCHDAAMAWIGMVLTHPDHRRRGYARLLVESALRAARSREIRCVKLDATDQGEALYRSVGFEAEQAVERWRRDPGPLDVVARNVEQGDISLALDAAAFGAGRSRFLRELGAAAVLPEAYALDRPGSRARYFGPCVARTPECAEQLARHFVAARPDESWFWDLLPGNEAVRRIAGALGFRPVRRLIRMWLGEHVRGDDSLVYAIAGFEAG
jgi:GNAT superfamily N-acetyltransferase